MMDLGCGQFYFLKGALCDVHGARVAGRVAGCGTPLVVGRP